MGFTLVSASSDDIVDSDEDAISGKMERADKAAWVFSNSTRKGREGM